MELIRTLNKFGHGVSYSQLEENDTALCLQKLATGLNHRVALPSSIKPYVFTTLAWDNIDRLEETLTGKGTSHRVNGIAVQARIYGPHLPTADLPCIEKKKKRMKKDEEAVSSIVDLIQGWINPFSEKQGLINISTARIAPTDIICDLMRAQEIGEQCYVSFKEERLEKDPPTKNFQDPIPTNKLKTFSNLCKKKVVKSS